MAADAVLALPDGYADQSRAVLDDTARSQQDQVKVAAASGTRNLPDTPLGLIGTLLKDSDAGVRKVALRSIDTSHFAGLEAKVESIAESDAEDFIREIADQMVKWLS